MQARIVAPKFEGQCVPLVLDYLAKIGREGFPVSVTDPKEIGAVAVLEAAGLVDAEFLPTSGSAHDHRQAELGIVKGITPKGRVELARMTSRRPMAKTA